MHHITEDTPPDMLAGAMDLAIRLPDGRDVHMSIERSTPMMDLLVQVTTAHKLRPSEHSIQALAMACPQDRDERLLAYKPNTPLGALDTQCIRVLAKGTRAPAPKPPAPPGHQPFETTFRLQVHLPRNQFCVIRVGKHVLLEDIMRKVCEEKNLDPRKYEFRHPANIDKVLDPKRTLNDYEITEISVVHRGSGTLSSGDIMGLQREEERRKMQKTPGGVLNLIFRRGRTSMGSGSVSSDTRSISPTQSDDSRSVTPPAVQPPQLLPPAPAVQEQKPAGRPKPPQRKRRPAPKPPTQPPAPPAAAAAPVPATAAAAATEDELEECQPDVSAKLDNGLTICHSRNSSDSSGYHEASILSDNCNTTLPRRPKSTVIQHTNNNNNQNNNINANSTLSGSIADLSKSTGNLAKMIGQSKSTMSLTNAGRKKKAPPPPPVLKAASSVANISTVSSSVPVVASRSRVEPSPVPDVSSLTNLTIPQPKPRTIKPQVPVPSPRKQLPTVASELSDDSTTITTTTTSVHNQNDSHPASSPELHRESNFDTIGRKRGFQIGKSMRSLDDATFADDAMSDSSSAEARSSSSSNQHNTVQLDDLDITNIEMFAHRHGKKSRQQSDNETLFLRVGSNAEIHGLVESESYQEISAAECGADLTSNVSMLSLRSVDSVPGFLASAADNMKKWDNVHELDEISVCSEDRGRAWMVGDGSDTESTCPPTPSEVTSQPRAADLSALQNSDLNASQPGVRTTNTPAQQPTAVEQQQQSCELVTATPKQPNVQRIETVSMTERRSFNAVESVKMVEDSSSEREVRDEEIQPQVPAVPQQATDPIVPQQAQSVTQPDNRTGLAPLNPLAFTARVDKQSYLDDHSELESDWQYTLPSPPRAFRDSSPTNFTDMTDYDTVTFNNLSADSVVTSPQLFEKLASIRDTRSVSVESVPDVKSETTDTIVSGQQKSQVMTTSKYLSLENLEKRKSLVLERELASLKSGDSVDTLLRNQKNNLLSEIEVVLGNKTKDCTLSRTDSPSREKLSLAAGDSTLPNFKITTYDQPKAKINIFEDDSVRSNVDNKLAETTKRNSIADSTAAHRTSEDFTLLKKRHSLVSASTDNIYLPKRNSVDRITTTDEFVFKRPQDPVRFKHAGGGTAVNGGAPVDRIGEMVARSESFSSHKNGWSRLNPVKRSKSYISLDKYKDESKVCVQEAEEGMQKSNSLFNVSGLQSLEVMRMILPKLGNTPPHSPIEAKEEPLKSSLPKAQPASEPAVAESVSAAAAPTVVKKYHYGGPPAINLGTWSDRPKSQVSLKEDRDYKISNIATMKAKFSSQTNLNTTNTSTDTIAKPNSPDTAANFPSFNIRVNTNEPTDPLDGKINIKINSEPAKIIANNQNSSSNVIIKIGNGNEQSEETMQMRNENKLKDNHFYSRFLNQTTAAGYRKPLGNINGVGKVKPRPHSIAFDASCPDLSRVPIVRAVELKKPYKDSQGNRTITQIIHDTPELANGTGEFASKVSSPVKSNTLNNQYRHSSVYFSSENMNNVSNVKPSAYFNKPVTRGNSFAATRSNNTPVVKGFRTTNGTDMDQVNNRGSWNQYGTLPAKSTNQHVIPMFSQSMLKRTDHGFLDKTERNDTTRSSRQMVPTNGAQVHCPPPPPPQMPKITSLMAKNAGQPRQRQAEEPRDVLLESIRSFGGKAGLKTVK